MKMIITAAILLTSTVVFSASAYSGDTLTGKQATGNPGAWTNTSITEANIARAVEELPAIVESAMTKTSSKYADYMAARNRAVTHQRKSGAWVPGPPRDPQP